MEQIFNTVVAALIISILSAIGGAMFTKLKGIKHNHDQISNVGEKFDTIVTEHSVVIRAIRDMIRSSITRICDESLHNGSIAENQLRNLCELYESYKALGGNSYVDELFSHTTELPLAGSAFPGIEYMRRLGIDVNNVEPMVKDVKTER